MNRSDIFETRELKSRKSSPDSWWKKESTNHKDSWWMEAEKQVKAERKKLQHKKEKEEMAKKKVEKLSDNELKNLHNNCMPFNPYAVIVNKKVLKEITKELLELRGQSV